ncbi:MAG: transcription elongation factor GreA [Rikenellaceae bacterium]|jgi:transcription elongation factor GreA|nr:transcription elongation factor GreA [Rikenellaceae bacterium]
MAEHITYLTEEGFQKAKEELDHLRSVERPAASRAIAEARDKGDLSENAEYDAAKEAQGMLEMRISKLEGMLASARLLDKNAVKTDKVQILNKVTLLNHNTHKQVVYTLVSEKEANLKEGKLATTTPIAKALLGHAKGDIVEVSVPAGTLKLEILDISV